MAYSQFHDGFWTDPEIRKLSADDKFLLTWFITNPSRHYSGIYFFEFENISKQTGLSEKTIRKGIDTLSAIGFIKYNQQFSMVWVRKMARHEVVKSEKTGLYSDKQTKGVANHFKTLHNCPLIKDFLDYYAEMQIPYEYGIRQEKEKEKEEIEIPPITLSVKNPKLPKKVKTYLPDNFSISDAVREWAQREGHNHLEAHLMTFKDRAIAKGYQYVDWDRAFMVAIREDWGKVAQNPNIQQQKPKNRADPNCPICKGAILYQSGQTPDGQPIMSKCNCQESDNVKTSQAAG